MLNTTKGLGRTLVAGLLIGLFSWLTACSTTSGRDGDGPPDWLSGASRAYPAERYLIGTGAGREPASAKDRARADLAKNFAVAIDETMQDLTRVSLGAPGEGERRVRISREIDTRTHEVLEGVQIADLWFDPEKRRYHALAILRRVQARKALESRIEPLDKQTAAYLDRAAGSRDRLQRIAYIARAFELQQRRHGLQRLLRVVDRTGRGRPARWSLPRLKAMLDEAFTALSLRLDVEACQVDFRDLVARAAEAGLTATGITRTQDAPLVLHVRLALDEPSRAQGWYWIRGRLGVGLEADGRTLGLHRWRIKQSAVELPVARRRAKDEIAGHLRTGLRPVLIDFATEAIAGGDARTAVGEGPATAPLDCP